MLSLRLGYSVFRMSNNEWKSCIVYESILKWYHQKIVHFWSFTDIENWKWWIIFGIYRNFFFSLSLSHFLSDDTHTAMHTLLFKNEWMNEFIYSSIELCLATTPMSCFSEWIWTKNKNKPRTIPNGKSFFYITHGIPVGKWQMLFGLQ